MSQALYINNKKIDITKKPLSRKIRIGDIGDIGSRKSSFSYTLDIPKTANNIEVLEMLGVTGNTSRKPFETLLIDYIVDDLFLIKGGSGIIKESSNTFKLNVIDGFKSLSEILGDKKLIDLSLSDLNHTLTTQLFVDSFANTEGYIYALADFGQGIISPVKVEKQAPSIYCHTLFRRVFENNGLSLNGDFFTSDTDYLKEVLAPANGYLIEDLTPVETAKGSAHTDLLSLDEEYDQYTTFEDQFTFTDDSLVDSQVVSGDIQFDVAARYKLVFNIDYVVDNTNVIIEFKLNGVLLSTTNLDQAYTTKEITLTIEANVNDILSMHLKGNSATSPDEFGKFQATYDVDSTLDVFAVSGGQLITPDMYLADIKQIDFIKDVAARYCLFLHPIQDSGDFVFKQMNNILTNTAGAEDWSDKLSEKVSENYYSGYAKVNTLKYNYPDSIVIPTNDGEILTDNQNAMEVSNILTSIFEIPAKSVLLSSIQTYLIPIWEEVSSVIENKETQPKIMNVTLNNITINARLFTEAVGINVTSNVPILSTDKIDLQYMTDTYFSSFKSLIDNYKKYTLLVNLSAIDIYNIDFFKLKYFRQLGRYQYLNSVEYTPEKLSKIEVIEIFDT